MLPTLANIHRRIKAYSMFSVGRSWKEDRKGGAQIFDEKLARNGEATGSVLQLGSTKHGYPRKATVTVGA